MSLLEFKIQDPENPGPCPPPFKLSTNSQREPMLPFGMRRNALTDFSQKLSSAHGITALLPRRETGLHLAFRDDVRDKVCKQALHALSYALGLEEAWPVVRDLLLLMAAKGGAREADGLEAYRQLIGFRRQIDAHARFHGGHAQYVQGVGQSRRMGPVGCRQAHQQAQGEQDGGFHEG